MDVRIAVIALAGLVVLATGNAQAAPRYKLDPSSSRVLEITNLGGTEGCVPAKVQGRVVARDFDKRGTAIKGVTVEEKDGSRTFVNVDDLPKESMSMVDIGWVNSGLQTLLKQGNRVSLGVGACGAAGRVMVLDSVRPAR